MKTQEILLASALIAVVSGIGTALATGAFRGPSARAVPVPHSSVGSTDGDADAAEARQALEELRGLGRQLRLENTNLREQLAVLERRLAEVQSARTPSMAESVEPVAPARELMADDSARFASAPPEVTPEFVASVNEALVTIKAREDAERERQRKELQAQRIEERVTRLQQELGLNGRQASDLRSALIAQDDKREGLFASMRDGQGEPRDMRESFRAIREETHATLQGFLTPEQFAAYQQSEESDFGRRGFGDFGPGGPGARPEDVFGGRRGR